MDAGRLLKTVNDILEDEENLALQSDFQKVSTAYSDGRYDAVEEERNVLTLHLRESKLSNYVRSDLEILSTLEAERHFGDESLANINEILSSEAHTVKTRLNDFVSERQVLIDNFRNMKKAFDAFDFESRELTDSMYQFGFTLPETYRDFVSVQRVLSDMHNLLAAVADATGQPKDFRISYVSSSELQFYVDVGQALAGNMATVLDCALRLYAAYAAYHELSERFTLFKGDRKKEAMKLTSDEKADASKEFADELIAELKIEKPADQTSVRILFAKFLQHMQKGVGAEVRTPTIDEPEEPSEDASAEEKAEAKQLKKGYTRKIEIDIKNKEIYKLQVTDFGGIKLDFLEAVIKDDIKTLKQKVKPTKSRVKKKPDA